MVEIPFNDLSRRLSIERHEIDIAISRVLDSGYLVLGPENEALQAELAAFLEVPNVIPVANGTDALEIAFRSLEIEPGSLVVTVANAGGYSSTAIRQAGGIPFYVDIDSRTLQMSVETLKNALSSLAERISAVSVTHLFGKAAPIKEIVAACRGFGVPIVEDCAQSLGARVDGQMVGTFGDVATTSFYPTKNLGALGDGGALFTKSNQIAERARMLRQYGWGDRYVSAVPNGRNSRLDEMQAAILRFRLMSLDNLNERRREIFSRFAEAENLWGRFVHSPEKDFVAHLGVMICDDRKKFAEHLDGLGIGHAVHYPFPDYLQDAFRSTGRFQLEATEESSEKIISLPLFPDLTDEETGYIVESLRSR